MEGTRPEAIFEKYRFDTDALGMIRIAGIAKRIKEEYAKCRRLNIYSGNSNS